MYRFQLGWLILGADFTDSVVFETVFKFFLGSVTFFEQQ